MGLVNTLDSLVFDVIHKFVQLLSKRLGNRFVDLLLGLVDSMVDGVGDEVKDVEGIQSSAASATSRESGQGLAKQVVHLLLLRVESLLALGEPLIK